MKNLLKIGIRMALVPAACVLACSTCLAIDVAKLQELLAGGEKVTVVDVRTTTVFQREHIPGAINIPGTLVPEKKLPRLGKVVVYDEGLGRDQVGAKAVLDLNAKSGISAELLDGGFAAWQAAIGASTKGQGVHPEDLTLIAYEQLKKADPKEIVLVDLRKPRAQVRQDAQNGGTVPQPLTDLASEFPKTPLVKSPFNLPQTRQSGTGGPSQPPVLVLIDDGDGSAQTMARTLKANGVTRVVVLAGGESILARHGQSGSQRIGTTVGTRSSTITKPVQQ